MEEQNKYTLLHSIRVLGVAYLLLFFLGMHYAYLNKWRMQIAYWAVLIATASGWLVYILMVGNELPEKAANTPISWLLYILIASNELITPNNTCEMCQFLLLSSLGLGIVMSVWWIKCAIDLPKVVAQYNAPIEEALHRIDNEASTSSLHKASAEEEKE